MTDRDWRDKFVKDADEALAHPLVADVMREFADNMGFDPDKGLPSYGMHKVAHYVAIVTRAQALGIDPDLLRLTPTEANSEILRLAAEAALSGIPVTTIDSEEVR